MGGASNPDRPPFVPSELGLAPRGSAVDSLHARQNSRRGRSDLAVLVGLAVLAIGGVVIHDQYERYRDRTREEDFSGVCAIDEASIQYAIDAFVGDQGRAPRSMDDLVRWGLLTETSPDWRVLPDPADPTETLLYPDPSGRCA